jgi:hypothetical protein
MSRPLQIALCALLYAIALYVGAQALDVLASTLGYILFDMIGV